VFSIVCYSIETFPNLSETTYAFLRLSEIVVVVVFTIEYLTRIYIAPNKWRFIFSFYGLVDLFAILPFYLATAVDLRSLRMMQLLRFARVLKLARYNRAAKRFGQAISLVKEELVIFTLASVVMLYLSAVGIYHFEHQAQPEVFRTIFDCLWWAVTTLTTVGYGDSYPITAGGRVFTFGILMIGLGLIAVPTGILCSALSEIRRKRV